MSSDRQPHNSEDEFCPCYYCKRVREPSISSESTASDLTGPGRTIDGCFGVYGRALEIWVGKIAKALGKGPEEAAARITRRCLKMKGLTPDSKAYQKQDKMVERDCKVLVKYMQSQTPSTQIQVLDRIIMLARQDERVRDLLINVKAHFRAEQLLSCPCATLPPLLVRQVRWVVRLMKLWAQVIALEQKFLAADKILFEICMMTLAGQRNQLWENVGPGLDEYRSTGLSAPAVPLCTH